MQNTAIHDVPRNPQAPVESFPDSTPDTHDQILRAQANRWQIEELDKAIVSMSHKIDAATYDLLVMLREFDERGGWVKWGSTSCAHWLAWRCDLSDSAAREKMRVAHALKTLPETSTLFSRGVLSYSKARAITRIATKNTEKELLELAENMTAAQLDQRCRQRKYASAESLKTARLAMDTRYLRSWRNEERSVMCISAEMTLEDGLLLEKALDKAQIQLPESCPDDNISWQAQQVDALIMLAKAYLSGTGGDAAEKASSTADHYQVVLHVDEKALSGKCADTDDTGDQASCNDCGESQLPVETIRRLCCDGSVVPLIEDDDGNVLNVGRKQRIVPTAIRRALHARDGGCAFPGCSHTRFLDAHHIRHWAHNGETSLENTLLLCGAHHRKVHEGGFTIERDHKGSVFFRRADGKAIPDSGYSRRDWMDQSSDTYDIGESDDSPESLCVNEARVYYLASRH
ncbi:MAG: HNH endonuclease [Granulosicoccus sp.]|nr:HNH endonuclease [Granulosicoccus sp.]